MHRVAGTVLDKFKSRAYFYQYRVLHESRNSRGSHHNVIIHKFGFQVQYDLDSKCNEVISTGLQKVLEQIPNL